MIVVKCSRFRSAAFFPILKQVEYLAASPFFIIFYFYLFIYFFSISKSSIVAFFFNSSLNFAGKDCSQLCLLRITVQYRDDFYQSFRERSTWRDSQCQDRLTSNRAKLFPQYTKRSKDSSTRIAKRIKTVSRVMRKSNTTGTFYYISSFALKRNSHLCWTVEVVPSIIAHHDKRFAKKLDRYITFILFKDRRRCKYII